ncbi:hypothetical protein [Paenibacillus dendritiformis]|nr:hypothetical protein [Paenibacillus dendritiformis]
MKLWRIPASIPICRLPSIPGRASSSVPDNGGRSGLRPRSMSGGLAGEHPLTVSLTSSGGELLAEETFTLTVLPAALPKQKLMHTEWFHCDGIADRASSRWILTAMRWRPYPICWRGSR